MSGERVQRYAETISDEMASACGVPSAGDLARRVIEVADVEQKDLRGDMCRAIIEAAADQAEIRTLRAEVEDLRRERRRVESLMLNYATRAKSAPTPLAQWKDVAADLREALS